MEALQLQQPFLFWKQPTAKLENILLLMIMNYLFTPRFNKTLAKSLSTWAKILKYVILVTFSQNYFCLHVQICSNYYHMFHSFKNNSINSTKDIMYPYCIWAKLFWLTNTRCHCKFLSSLIICSNSLGLIFSSHFQINRR